MEVIHQFIDLKTIHNSDQIIHTLQNSVIALTNRSLPIIKRTIEQLNNIGIHFSKTAPLKKDADLFDTHKAKYVNGIIFSAHNDKGKILFNFLSKITPEDLKKIKRIIFIDDRLNHVKSVELAALQNNFRFR